MKTKLIDFPNKKAKGVYKIENTVTNQVYIGGTPKTNFLKRFRQHRNSLDTGRHDNSHLQRSYNEYKGFNFTFSIVEVVDGSEEDVLCREQFYIDYYNNKGLLFNKKLSSKYPPPYNGKGDDTKRRQTLKEGFVFYHKYKNKEITLGDIPLKYQSFVKGKSSFKVWNKGLTKENFDYSFLKVPKTKTESYFQGRESFKHTMRSKSKSIYVFDYRGILLDVYRSATDIVEASEGDIFPLVLQNNKGRKIKGQEKTLYKLEVNNILKVLKGKQKHHKGLIFSFDKHVDYILQPKDIKFCFSRWEQCYFHKKGAYKGNLYVESDEFRESPGEDNPEPSLT